MKFEYNSKSQEFDASGTASATKVILTNSDGANVPVFLQPEKINLSNAELLNQALEVIYQENFPQRAENEKFNTLGEKIAKFDSMMERMDTAIKKAESETEQNRELVRTISLTLNELLESFYEDEEVSNNETTEEN